MFQIAIGVGTDELAPEMFIRCGSRERRRRLPGLDGKRVSALIAKLRVFLILLLALRAGFHLSESITMETSPG